jgi:hypothetical protein
MQEIIKRRQERDYQLQQEQAYNMGRNFMKDITMTQ